MASTDSFCLQWNEFGSSLTKSLRSIRSERDFFDVTLACEDNQIFAHKLILAASSPFFRKILKANPHNHPLLYLKGVKYKELMSILEFLYMGQVRLKQCCDNILSSSAPLQVNIAETELECFLAAAADLKVRGLSQAGAGEECRVEKLGRDQRSASTRDTAVMTETGHEVEVEEEHQYEETQHKFPGQEEELRGKEEVDLEPVVTIHHRPDTEDPGLELEPGLQARFPVDYTTCYADHAADWYTIVTSKMSKRDNVWICCDCEYSSRNKTSLISHVEGKHVAEFPGYLCTICGTRSGTYCGFEKHMSRQHKYSLARKTSMNANLHQDNVMLGMLPVPHDV